MIEALLRFLATLPGLGVQLLFQIYQLARAHYNIAGKHTAPIEQEFGIDDANRPQIEDFRLLFQIIFTIIPVIPLAWLFSLLVMPVIYNSLRLTVTGFIRGTNLGLFDLDEESKLAPIEELPWYRMVYGLPGLLLGTVVGGLSLASIFVVRTLTNTFKNFATTFVNILNLGLGKYKLPELNFEESAPIFKFLGGLGYIFGGILGVVALGFSGIGLSLIHSWYTGLELVGSAINIVRKETVESHLSRESSRSLLMKYGFGLPGLILGFIPASLAFFLASIERFLIESWKTTTSIFQTMAKAALPTDKQDQNQENERSAVDSYFFGLPGIFLGLSTGLFAFIGIGLARIVRESAESFMHIVAVFTNSALPKELEFEGYGLSKDYRRPLHRYGLGAPGILLGTIIGPFGLLTVIAGRIITNSLKSMIDTIMVMANLALDERDQLTEIDWAGNVNARSSLEIYGFGFPGSFFGFIAGVGAIAAVLAGRLITNSFKTASSLVITAINIVRRDEFSDPFEQKDKTFSMTILGLPGLVLGIVPALIAFSAAIVERLLVEGWKTALETINYIVAPILPKYPEEKSTDAQVSRTRNLPDRVFGFWAVFPGFILGTIGFFSIAVVRTVTNSARSFIDIIATITNFVLEKEDQIRAFNLTQAANERSLTEIYAFGSPGVFLGAIAGVITMTIAGLGRCLTNSWKTGVQTVGSAINLLRKNEVNNDLKTDDGRTAFMKFGLGFPGLLLGIIPGLFGFAAAFIERSLIESWITTKSIVNAITKTVLPEKIQSNKGKSVKKIPDQRSFIDLAFGIWGLIPGAIAGGVGFVGIAFVRTITNSAKSFIHMAATIINAALETEIKDYGLAYDKRNGQEIYGFGLFGIGLGVIAGSIGFAVVGLARAIEVSWQTMVAVTMMAIKFVWKEEIEVPYIKDKNAQELKNFYLRGFPGMILGIVTGSLAFVAASLGRAINESWITTKSVFTTIVNYVLPEEIEPSQEVRTSLDVYFFGASGLILGSFFGSITFALIALGRTFMESLRTSQMMTVAAINLVRKEPLSYSPRSNALTYGFGFPGLLIGIVPSILGFTVTFLERMMSNSLQSFVDSFATVVNLALWKEYELQTVGLDKNNARTSEEIYGYGVLGIGLGGIIGAIAYVLIGFAQIVSHNINSGVRSFRTMANLGTEPKSPNLEIEWLAEEDDRHWVLQYLVGCVGLVSGGFIGGMVSAAVNNYRSMISLGGSLLNLALGSPIFEGIANDKRENGFKALGSLGYLTALSLAPLVLVVVTARKIIPSLVAITLGALGSIFVAPVKWYRLIQEPRNFETISDKSVRKKIKNLYSSLDAWGNFPEEETIATNAAGNKGVGNFIRKTFTFDQSTVTEMVLDEALDACAGKVDGQYIVKNVADRLKSKSCCESKEAMELQENQIRDIVTFIDDYLEQRVTTVPQDLYSKHEKNFKQMFFGTPKTKNIYSSNKPSPELF